MLTISHSPQSMVLWNLREEAKENKKFGGLVVQGQM